MAPLYIWRSGPALPVAMRCTWRWWLAAGQPRSTELMPATKTHLGRVLCDCHAHIPRVGQAAQGVVQLRLREAALRNARPGQSAIQPTLFALLRRTGSNSSAAASADLRLASAAVETRVSAARVATGLCMRPATYRVSHVNKSRTRRAVSMTPYLTVWHGSAGDRRTRASATARGVAAGGVRPPLALGAPRFPVDLTPPRLSPVTRDSRTG